MKRIFKYLKYHKGQKGIALVWMALMLTVLLMLAGLAIDIGYMYYVKNQLQVAADAAALAGAANLDGTNSITQEPARQAAWKFACKNTAAGSNVYLVNTSSDCDSIPGGLNIVNNDTPDDDIVVGYWDGTDFSSTGTPVNAVKVRARRTSGSPGGAVRVFLGQIFKMIGGDWSLMSARAEAIAATFPTLLPVGANEYWMGDSPLGSGDPASPDPNRDPHGRNHVYPNSFIRPPCVTQGATTCSSPTNGNVGALPGGTTANGPLTSSCAGAECRGRPTQTSGRVFAIIGGNVGQNSSSGNMFGLIDLDRRISYSMVPPGGQWYKVSGNTFTQIPFADSNPDKDIAAGYIAFGAYPNILPVSATEVYQPPPGYPNAVSLYTSIQPYASVSFFSGAGAVGQVVKDNFYDSGNYSGGKYTPGKKIIVAVYDGVVGGTGNQSRTTIVGFTSIKIFGYGSNLIVTGNNPSDISVTGTETSIYGYVESIEDSLKPNVEDFLGTISGHSKLVK